MRSRGRFFAAIVGALAVFAASSVSAAVGTIEEFEDETADSTTFSESGGPVFTVTGDLKVEFFTELGSTPPDSPDDDFLFVQDLSFSGTALDGVPLTSLEVFLTAELAPDAGSGSFDYLAHDNIDFTTSFDTTPPVLTVPADISQSTDAGLATAAVSFVVTATDNVDAVSPTCSPASGSVFPLGTTVVTCMATDTAGNTGAASFDVTVEVGDGAVRALIAAVTDLGLPNGAESSLLSTLKNVDKLFDDGNPDNDGAACDKLTSFVGKVAEKEAAGTLTATEADQLTAFAQAIAAANACVAP